MLHPQADPEKWFAGNDRFFDNAFQAEGAELGDRRVKRTDPGEDDSPGSADCALVAGDLGGKAELLDRFFNAPQVPRPVVDDRYRHSAAAPKIPALVPSFALTIFTDLAGR